MRPHVGAKTLARYRQGDLSPRRNSRIGAHLARCARCRALNEDLAGVTALLASVHPPPIPEHLAARIQAVLATEAATRATRPAEKAPAGEKAAATAPAPAGTGPAGTGPAANGRRPRPGVPGPGRRPRLTRPVPAAALAAAAAVVLLAGGIYGLTRLGASPTSSSASGSAAAPEAPVPGTGGPAAHAPTAGSALPYQHTGTDYTPGNLSAQVAAQLARYGRNTARSGPNAMSPVQTHSPATASGGSAATFGGVHELALAGCVNRIAAGERVLLVDVARYQGARATVIVTQPTAGGPEQIWVVGTGCSASRSDLLHHATLNTAG